MRSTINFFISIFCFSIFNTSIVIITCLNCVGQSVVFKAIGTSSHDAGSLYKTENGFQIIGYTTINGSEDMYILRLDDDLDIVWSKTFGTNAGDRAMEMVQKPDGNLLISGWGSSGSSTALLELDQNGLIVNAVGFGYFHDRLYRIIKTNDGGYLNYGELEGAVPGHNKPSMIKYDSHMNIEWVNYYSNMSSSDNSSSVEVYGRKAVQLPDGSFVILGSYTEIHNHTNNRRIRLIKVDKHGNEEWTRGFHGGRMDNAHHMILCADGGYLISATSNSYSDGETDILLVKTNNNGDKEWIKTFGGGKDDLAGELLQLPNGNFMISGSTTSFGAGGSDFLLFEIDGQGQVIKGYTYGEAKDENLIRLIGDAEYFLLSGTSNSNEQADNNVYIVKTKFEDTSSACSHDITTLIQTKEVSSTFFNEHYSQGIFSEPSNIALNGAEVNSLELEPCINCEEGTNNTYILCPNEKIQMDYSDITDGAVKWHDESTNVIREISEEGIFWVEYQKKHCSIRDSIYVEKEEELDLGNDRIICPGEQAIVDATSPNALSYTWHDNSNNPVYKASEQGTIFVKVMTENCTISDTINIHQYTTYEFDLGQNKTICYGETVLLDASIPGALNYLWHDGNTNPIYQTSNPGVYKIEITTNCNIISDSIELKYPEIDNIFIPNVITPNSDEINEHFEISGIDSPVQLTIVNRWGNVVYFSESYNNSWNGGNLATGTYYYLVDIGCTNQELKGWLQILRD